MKHEPTKTALVTGASQGLGRAMLHHLVAAGWNVAGVARTAAPLRATVASVEGPGSALALPADVGQPDAAARVVGAAQSAFGPIDLLVHAASTLGPTPLRPLLELEPTELDRVWQVNVAGPFRLTRLVAGAMALRGSGTVVFVSSDAAVEAYPTWGVYGATKAALDHLSRIWATEVPTVRFVAVDPGEMDTAMHAAALPGADRSQLARPEAVAERIWHRLGDARSGERLVVAS